MRGRQSLFILLACAFVVVGSASASGHANRRTDASNVTAAASSEDGGAAAAPIGRYLLQTRGLWAEFEDLRQAYGYYDGELLDALSFPSAQRDVTAQLVRMRAMGMNEIGFELTSGDGNQATPFPDCKLSTFLGPQWPQPTVAQLTGLGKVFDLAQRQGMKVMLILDSTHMEEQPPTNAQLWLGAILNEVKDKPALDLVAFGGDRHVVANQPPFQTPDSCGGHSEAPLWLGPDSLEARYVQWAIGYGMSLGLPAQKLTAEAIVGDYRHEAQQPAGPAAEDGHLWRPVEVMRTIFDRLKVPDAQRTYALSYYSHPKCAFVSFGSCSDEDQFTWTQETLQTSRERVGSAARMTLIEWGASRTDPAVPDTVERLGALMQQLSIEGGVYYKWADASANDPNYAYNPDTLVKVRGTTYTYHPVQKAIADLYGFHLTAVPNGSFEDGTSPWTTRGAGTAQTATLDQDLPWRGVSYIHLVATGAYSLSSPPIRVSPRTSYTTTANLRFGQPNASATFTYLTCANKTSKKSKATVFRLGTAQPTWQTFPFAFTTPSDTCYVQITFRMTGAGTLDADAVR